MSDGFSGFPRECFRFYRELEKNNTRQWFEQHRPDYEAYVLGPARCFVSALGARLARLAPGIHAEPLVDRSIFRIYRDVRFSGDKRPFKTNLGIWLWEGDGKRMESSGFYVMLEANTIMLGAGIYLFPGDLLRAYRDSAVHPRHGRELAAAIRSVTGKKEYGLGGSFFKKVPRGYPADHPNAGLLLHNGLWAGASGKIPKEAHTAGFVSYCCRRFEDLLPVHRWLYELTRRAG